MIKLILSIIIVLTYIVNTSYAVYFKVICSAQDYGGTGVSVNIDGVSYPMTSANADILYELTYDGVPKQYYYEITGTALNELTEFNNVPRTWDPASTSTLYEIYGRPVTLGDDMIATIPRIYEPLPGYDKFSVLFQEGEVPVISVHLSNADYLHLTSIIKKENIAFTMEFDLFTPYEKYHFTNATLSFSGQGSVIQEKKPYKFDLSGNEEDKANSEIFNRKEFKLRSLRYDESYMKNKIAMDMAESLGLPLSQTAACRLYVNNKGFGLYELSDMYKKKFVRRFFDPPNINEEYVYGSLYKGVSSQNNQGQAIPAYLYPDFDDAKITDLYENIVTSNSDPMADIQKIITWINALPATATKEEIEQKFDIDMFLKYATLEYLTCHWDGYLSNGNNYFIYAEPSDGKYHFFSYDFDLTLGKWCKAPDGDIDNYILNVVSEDSRFYGSGPQRKPLLYTKIIKNPNINPLFNAMVKEVVGNLFNIEALGPRLNYFYEFYKYDMYWDIDCLLRLPTKTFGNDKQDIPKKSQVDDQYSDASTNIEDLRCYIKNRAATAAKLYGVTSFSAEGKYGVVGGKLMTIGKATKAS